MLDRQYLSGLIFLALLSSSCQPQPPVSPPTTLMSRAATEAQSFALYRFTAPANWQRIDTAERLAPLDTMQPLAHYRLETAEGQLELTIHNFPVDTPQERIAPQAQVARWQKQFEQIEPERLSVTSQAFGGFTGLRFEAEGQRAAQPHAVLAWSMQLAPQFYTALELQNSFNQQPHLRHLQADFTIKVYGSPALLKTERNAIIAAARSLALQQELPQPF